ncbi:MAG: hypothetical protein CMI31_12250 [Opitutae bacterium]|nr:hypothetical protein [Opitutae bacterium]|tara:strand:- start:2669 stop:3265 length:597 start_codon:yes stop_codon:yes gene_type:complete
MMGRMPIRFGGCLILLTSLGSLPASICAQANVRLANLTQDVELLSRQVAILRSEVEALRRENAQLKATSSSNLVTRDNLRSLGEIMDNKFSTFRSEITSSNATHKKDLLKEVNAKLTALAKQTKQQFDTMAKAPPAAPAAAQVNYPNDGTVYTVKGGDTLSAIARKHGSRVSWIKAANNIVKDTSLQVGRAVFIPQNN